ncbi:MAG: hypothetical protein JKY03_14980 [Aureispira sp.]|nr:hypothetical protein [Aureispira sp.]
MPLLESNWIIGNTNGKITGSSIVAGEITAIAGQEQDGYGIVNCWVSRGNPPASNGSCTSNHNGKLITKDIKGRVSSFLVQYQDGYGVVNFGVVINEQSYWVGSNFEGTKHHVDISVGTTFIGFQAREEDGYGIVDMKVWMSS